MPRYEKLGYVTKKRGFQMWEFHFNYGLLHDDIVEVFVIKKPKKRRVVPRPQKEALKG